MRRGVLSFALLFVLVRSASPPSGIAETPVDAVTIERCEDVGKASKERRCALVRELCSEESRKGTLSIDYLSTYYCHIESASLLSKALFWTLLCGMGVILFSLLGDTAEKYFSPALTQICQQVPKMRPRFAGVTVLAFANGAPDLSATINAIKTCKFNLSLGALTGAGMFVNCFVAGWIILISGGARCRGATIRDVSTYFLTVFGVLIALLSHRMGIAAVVLAFLLYGVFVLVVFGADEWHEQGRPDFWSKPMNHIASSFRLNQEAEDALLNERRDPVWATYEDAEDEVPNPRLISTARAEETDEDVDADGYPAVWAQLSPAQYRQQALAEMAGSDDDLYDYPLDSVMDSVPPDDMPLQMEPLDMPFSTVPPMGSGVLPFETEHNLTSQPTGLFAVYPWLMPIWETLLMDDVPSEGDRWWVKAFLVVRLPFVLLQRATIPLTSQEHFSNFWLITSIGLSPFMTLIYFNFTDWLSFLIAILLGALLAASFASATKGSTRPPVWSFGTSWPIGASLMALYGLVIGIFWIDILAGELVDLLYCAGIVTGIPEAVLGLTVLAWGNSIGDFFTNSSIAKAGKGNMALTACYAGPVFNMLLGLGLGFISFFATQHHSTASIHVGPQVILGCVCLLVHAASVVVIGVRKGFRLPARFGYFSMGIYALYLAIAVSLQFLVGAYSSNDAAQCMGP